VRQPRTCDECAVYRDEVLREAAEEGTPITYQDACEHAHLMAQQEVDIQEEEGTDADR